MSSFLLNWENYGYKMYLMFGSFQDAPCQFCVVIPFKSFVLYILKYIKNKSLHIIIILLPVELNACVLCHMYYVVQKLSCHKEIISKHSLIFGFGHAEILFIFFFKQTLLFL
jgi:hypothetical protein